MMRMTKFGALLLGGALALAGCAGSDGAAGAPGANGSNGTNGTNGVNGVTGKMLLAIDGVETVGTTSTVTFTITPAAIVCPGAVCDPKLAILGQKTFYAQEFNAGTNTFDTNKNVQFNQYSFKGFTADGKGAQYTAWNSKASPSAFVPETSQSAFVYGYIGTKSAVPADNVIRHYYLPGQTASAAKLYGTVNYASKANVTGCEKCHGAPYSKHGYRQAKVNGIPDFAACKVCHTDQRPGSDAEWYVLADDPATLADAGVKGISTTVRAKYPYVANIMNDTHNSHAFEFNYPQSMANCVTCHAGKIADITVDANFKPAVCKSCHPITAVAGIETGRAPSLKSIWTKLNVTSTHQAFIDNDALYTDMSDTSCNASCHKASTAGKRFSQIHAGYSKKIYKDAAGARWSDSYVTSISSVAYNATTHTATLTFDMAGVPANGLVKPTVVASLYGYGTKDFLISGHSSQFADKTPNLEWAEGAKVRGTQNPANTSRLTVSPATATAGAKRFVATIDLSTWAGLIDADTVKRIEVAFLPAIGLDPAIAWSGDGTKSNDNMQVAAIGATATVDVSNGTTTTALVAPADSYGKGIVSWTKCNACHDALGTTFHNPNYGSAGPVGCRLCHVAGVAGGHLEMQSRSIDSYIHAIHSMQEFDISGIDMTDSVEKLRYTDKVEGKYPNFAGNLNCESCHAAGTYDVPDQSKSLPGVLSASSAFAAGSRNVGSFAGEITGPAARACGACHRAQAINEDDGSKLAAFVSHTNDFSTFVGTTSPQPFLDTAAYVEYLVGAGPSAPKVDGARVEECMICHPTSGSDHQKLFNVWKNGLNTP